jgi:small subunit ribosomal protein S17
MGDGSVGRKKSLTGVVVSNKMDKTAVVSVTRLFQHPMYKKYVKTQKKYKAHDERNACSVGDRVLIVECRPISKDKHFRVGKILEKVL